jgi:transposase
VGARLFAVLPTDSLKESGKQSTQLPKEAAECGKAAESEANRVCFFKGFPQSKCPMPAVVVTCFSIALQYNGRMGIYKRTADLEFEIARQKIEYEAEIAKLQTEITELQAENERKDLLIKHYLEQLALAQHRMFGMSSERTEITGQTGLFNEAENLADISVAEPEEIERIDYTRKKRKGNREEFYKNVPVKEVVHELPEEERICPRCGRPLHECGREVVRCELEHIPASVSKVNHVQVIYGGCDCDKEPESGTRIIVKSDVPAPVIPNSGIASPSLVAYIVSNKYVLALPLNRQAEEFKRLGIEIPKQNLANWVIFVANVWLAIIWSLLRDELLANEIIHADESTHQVINEKGRKASQKSYMWAYFTGRESPRQVALFEYQETREKEHPLKLLEGFSGKLHVDAYAGYLGLEAQGVTLSYCWSHVRRKFFDVLKPLPKDERKNYSASIGVRFCDHLFFFEEYYDEEGFTREQRERWRELLSIPVAEEFFAWAESMLPKVKRESQIWKAVSYAVNCKARLMNAFYDGRLELSNNRSERGIRPYAIGRLNWKFSYSPEGAKASAISYSIVETALANGLMPYVYLKYLFETLPNIPKERYHECLPWNPQVKKMCAIPKPNPDKPEKYRT